jgi:hypothetical protein
MPARAFAAYSTQGRLAGNGSALPQNTLRLHPNSLQGYSGREAQARQTGTAVSPAVMAILRRVRWSKTARRSKVETPRVKKSKVQQVNDHRVDDHKVEGQRSKFAVQTLGRVLERA